MGTKYPWQERLEERIRASENEEPKKYAWQERLEAKIQQEKNAQALAHAQETAGSAQQAGEYIVKQVNDLIAQNTQAVTAAQQRYASRKNTPEDAYVADSGTYFETLTQQQDLLYSQANGILDYLSSVENLFDKEWVSSVRKTVQAVQLQQAQMVINAENDSAYWKQWENADAYKAYQDQWNHMQMLQNMDTEAEEQKRVAEYSAVETKIAELQKMRADAYEAAVNSSLPKEQTEALWAKVDRLDQRIATLAERSDYLYMDRPAEIYNAQMYQKFGTLQSNADWAKYSQQPVSPERGIIDALNFNEGQHIYEALTEEEKKEYSYVYNKMGEKAAKEYLEYMSYTANARRMQGVQEWAQKFADDVPVLSDIASIPMNLVSGIGYLDLLGQEAKNLITGEYRPLDYNTMAMAPSVGASGIRGQRAQNIQQDWKNSELLAAFGIDENTRDVLGQGAGGVYQLGMSMADSAAVAALGKIGVPPAVGTTFLAGSAAAQGVRDAVARGATDEQALASGFMNGVFEWLFEKYEIDGMLGAIKDGNMGAVVKQAITEGFGEGATSTANIVADAIIMAEKSNWELLRQQYKASGMDDNMATLHAFKDMAIQVGVDTFGGMLMGGLSTGGAVAIDKASGAVKNTVNNYQVGKTIIQKAGGVEGLKNLAGSVAESATDSKAKEQIEKLAGKVTDKGGVHIANQINTGRLFSAIRDVAAQHSTEELAKNLSEKGFDTERATQIAEAVHAVTTKKATAQQVKMLGQALADNNVAQAIMEVSERPSAEVGSVKEFAQSVTGQQAVNQMTDEEATGMAQRLSQVIGREIVMYSEDATENGIQNGYYKGGKIYINRKSGNPFAQIVAHELTHSTEAADMYADLSKEVLRRISSYEDLNALRKKTMELYAANGVMLDKIADADKEIVADWIAENLLTDEQAIRELCQEKPSLGRRILRWLDGLLAKLGNKNAKEREFLRRARDLYAQALGQSQQPGTAKSQREVQEQLEEIRQAYRAGELTEEEFDSIMDSIQEWEEQNNAVEPPETQSSVSPTFESIEDDYREETKNPTVDGGVQYSIVNLDTGKSYVQASRQVIHGDSIAEWRSQISGFFNRALKNGPIEIETIEGDMLTISKYTAEKARSKTATENGISRELTDKEFLVKLHAEAHIDELAEISHKSKRPPVPDGKNHGFAKDGFTYRTVYFQDFDGTYYKITLSVGENNGISTVYNVGKIKADDIPDGKIISTIGSKADMSSTKFSISENSSNVKKFSDEVRDSYQEDADAQFSIDAGTISKRDVAQDLRKILSRGGNVAELRRYIAEMEASTPARATEQEEGSEGARNILRAARHAGLDVEEYLAQNWEQYDEDGQYNAEAREALDIAQAGKNSYRAETKNPTADGGVRYSLCEFEDGTRYVDVQMDAHTFDGMSVAEMNRAAKQILMQKFAGKVIGLDNQVFVNGDSVNEYLHPSKAISADIRKAKLTASGELDNLLDAGKPLPNQPDGMDGHIHPEVTDFSYLRTIFKVGKEYFEGIVNIKNIKRGRLLKDVTKIRNITKDIVSSYGTNPKSNFLRDVSMNSIRYSSEDVNQEYLDTVNRGDMQAAQKMVDEAAKAAGYDSGLLYHGTQSFGFTEFDLEKMDDKQTIFLTSNERIASTYSGVIGKRNASPHNVPDVLELSMAELVEELNSKQYDDGTDPDDKCRYFYMSLQDVNALIGSVNSQVDGLKTEILKMIREYADRMATDFDSKDHRTHEQLVQLDKLLKGYDYKGISTQLYMLLHHTDAFNSTMESASRISKLEQDIRLMEKLRNRDNTDGVIIESWLNGYSLTPLDPQQARDKLAVKRKTGNYALYAKLGKTLDINVNGGVWNDIRHWARSIDISTDNTVVQRQGEMYKLIDKATGQEISDGEFAVNPYTSTMAANQRHAWMVQKAQSALQIITENMNTTREIAAFAKKRGYDSVIFRNVKDNGGRNVNVDVDELADIYVVFDPNNVKSADPVTYDDKGNVIPLSERFNVTNRDIRYSISRNTEDVAATQKAREERMQELLDSVSINHAAQFEKYAELLNTDPEQAERWAQDLENGPYFKEFAEYQQLVEQERSQIGRNAGQVRHSISEPATWKERIYEGSKQEAFTEEAAHKYGYPVIGGIQIVPFKTWVLCQDPKVDEFGNVVMDMNGEIVHRNNYGLVVGIKDAQHLVVKFDNKTGQKNTERGKKNTKVIATEYLTPVAGSYQMRPEEFHEWERLIESQAIDPETLTAEELAEIEELRRRADSEYAGEPGEVTPLERETLPPKARDALKRAEGKTRETIGKALEMPKGEVRKVLQGVSEEMATEYLRTGHVSQETMDRLFDAAYEQAIVIDSDFYDQYEPVKKHLRTTPITISEQDKADIADFKDFRRRTRGTLRIVNNGGLPVDSYYRELREMAPELFPDYITHPADQLRKMHEVSVSIQRVKRTLDEYHGENAAEARRWAKYAFEGAVADLTNELWKVRRYTEAATQKDENTVPMTVEEVMETYQKLKDARKNYEKVLAKNLLTAEDTALLGDLLAGKRTLDSLSPDTDNIQGIEAVYRAKVEMAKYNKLITQYRENIQKEHRALADEHLSTASLWKDKKAGMLYRRETMRRNIQDIVPDPNVAAEINKTFFEPVQISEAESTRFKKQYRERVRGLNISRKVRKGDKVSEAYAVQLYGEAIDNIRMIEKSRGRMKDRDGRSITEWEATIADLWAENPSLDKAKIERAVEEMRSIYNELFEKMNVVRVANGYEPVSYRAGYFPHFQAGRSDGVLAHFGRALGINTDVVALPTTINGLTHTFKPGIQWFGNAQERKGFQTEYDVLQGFDKYIEGVANVIHQTENIQRLRALATQVRYRTGDDRLRERVDEIRAREDLSSEDKAALINEVYTKGKFELSNFAVQLDEYTNLLAGKKSMADRSAESNLGRRMYTFMKWWEGRVGANMIGGNLSSATTNFIPLTQASARLGNKAMVRGMWDALKNIKESDALIERSDFVTNRRGSDLLTQTTMQKVSDAVSKPMEIIDGFVSESIVRAAYYRNLEQGMSEEDAMHQADIFAAGVMADRSKGAMPTLFEARNPWYKMFTQFQLEVNNQFSELFKDVPREQREKGIGRLIWVLLKYFAGAYLFNDLFERLFGRRPAMDPLGILNETVGNFTGYELPNLFEIFDPAVSFETKREGTGPAIVDLGVSILEQLPFTAMLTMLGVEMDQGRIAATSVIPDFFAILNAAFNEEWAPEKRWKEVQDELNKLANIIPPVAGNQLSKIYKGIKAYIMGGSYTVDEAGNDVLQYPVYNDEDGDFWSMVRAMIMGKNSLPEAQDWVDSNFDGLSAKQTALYQELMDAGTSNRNAYGLVRELEKANALGGQEKKETQSDLLIDSQLSDEEKMIVMKHVLGDKLVSDEGNPTNYAKMLCAVETGLEIDEYLRIYSVSGDMDKYFDFIDSGMDSEDAADMTIAFSKIEPEVGAERITDLQKWKTCVEENKTMESQLAALRAVMREAQYDKAEIVSTYEIDLNDYLKLLSEKAKYDVDGNGSLTQAEAKAMIQQFNGSRSQKAALWQVVTGSTSGKNNPFDSAIGKKVSEEIKQRKEARAETEKSDEPLTFSEEVMRQIMARVQ